MAHTYFCYRKCIVESSPNIKTNLKIDKISYIGDLKTKVNTGKQPEGLNSRPI
jgi:hypothetical protein